ncbi:MAG TPA: DUF1565 domain-containing protein [Candidatus Tumulicola sp.]
MSWCVRAFFALLATASLVALIDTAACTRRGGSSTTPPTATPLTTFVVNPKTGSDTTGNGSSTAPFKTLTKALSVVAKSTAVGLTVQLMPGTYTAANGEIFPIVIPTAVTIDGSGYGGGAHGSNAAFITGAGEDVAYEKLINRTSTHQAFATLEIAQGVSGVQINRLYMGDVVFNFPASASYAAMDALGSFDASSDSFAAGSVLTRARVAGLMVPGGSVVTCTGCNILGSTYALLAFSVAGLSPTITLAGQPSQSAIGGQIGILTDGTASIGSSFQTFQSSQYGYRDAFAAPVTSPQPTPLEAGIDFGGGPEGSSGGNVFIGAKSVLSEISVTTQNSTVYALANTWNPSTQGSNVHGQYPRMIVFGPPTVGRNVTIGQTASGSSVEVGPPAPPSPSTNPSSIPSSIPSPSPT